jgi:integrase
MSVHKFRNKFRADAGCVNGKRLRKVFSTKKDAENWLRGVIKDKQRIALGYAVLGTSQTADALEARKLANDRITLTEAVRFWIKWHPETSIEDVKKAVDAFISEISSKGLRPRYIKKMRNILSVFCDRFGSCRLSNVHSDDIAEWSTGQGWSEQTRVYRMREIVLFFNWAVKSKLLPENPALFVPLPRIEASAITVLNPCQARAILSGTQGDTRAYFALAMFSGVRTSELERLKWKDVKIDRGIVDLSSAQSKTRSRRIIKLQPNAIAWLRPLMKDSDTCIRSAPLRKLIAAAKVAAAISNWPQNVSRHSFGSYHLAHFRNIDETALQMGHTTTAMLFRHYREVVSQEDAAAYWDIWPDGQRI